MTFLKKHFLTYPFKLISDIFKQEISIFYTCLAFKDTLLFFQLGCFYEFSKIMVLQYKYTYTHMWKKVLGMDKLKSMYKKGKIHGEEHWMFKY